MRHAGRLLEAVLCLLDQPSATLADIPRLFNEKEYREDAIRRLTHPATRDFWLKEFAAYPYRYRIEALAPVQNKLGAFLAQPPLYRLLTRPRAGYRLRDVMDGKKVLLVNLSKGKIGGDGAALLGSLIVSRLGLTGVSRTDIPESSRVPYSMIAPALLAQLSGLVASHHGAAIAGTPPTAHGGPSANVYAALSYGAGNWCQHPDAGERADLRAAGWRVQYLTPNGGVQFFAHQPKAPSCSGSDCTLRATKP